MLKIFPNYLCKVGPLLTSAPIFLKTALKSTNHNVYNIKPNLNLESGIYCEHISAQGGMYQGTGESRRGGGGGKLANFPIP